MHAIPHISQTPGVGHGHQQNHHQAGNTKPVKVKRTRQRVDAGEPRNSYASIANFSSRGGYHGYSHKYGGLSSHSQSQGSSLNGGGGGGSGGVGVHGAVAGGSSGNSNSQQHQSQASHSLASSNAGSIPAYQANSDPSMFASKLREPSSSINAVAAMAAAAASRPEMLQLLQEPNIVNQFYQQNQMAVILNGAYSNQMKGVLKFGSSEVRPDTVDQLALNNAFSGANTFFNQLQSTTDNSSMANFMNNFNVVESAAAAAFLNTPGAQLLRDILEASPPNNTEKTSQQLIAQQALVNKLNDDLSHKSHQKQSRSNNKRYEDSEADIEEDEYSSSLTTVAPNVSKGHEDSHSLATPGEDRQNRDVGGVSDDKTTSEEENAGPSDNEKTKETEGYGDADFEEEEEDAVKRAAAKDKIGVLSGLSGSGIESVERITEEVAKIADVRDGNAAKEERRGRGRPSMQLLAQRRDKSAGSGALPLGSTSSLGGTSLAEEASSASFLAASSTSVDQSQLAQTFHEALFKQNDTTCSKLVDLAGEAVVDEEDPLTADDDPSALAESSQSHSKRTRVENIVSNMLLVTSPHPAPAGAGPGSSPSRVLSPHKGYQSSSDDDADSNSIKPSGQGVNGCKKRKLYQPQQSSKLVNANGCLDTEDDDIEDDDMGATSVVEAELDDSFDDHEDRQRHASPRQSELPKEADVATSNAHSRQTSRSEQLPIKRARMTDYEREYKLQQMQSQLYMQKYALHLYAQQQQQQQQSQSKPVNGSNHHYPRASPVNATPNAQCDNHEEEEKERQQAKQRHTVTRIYDIELLKEVLRGEIMNSVTHIIESTFRNHLESSSRYGLENGKDTTKGNELLAQMLDAKYTRGPKNSVGGVISLNNGSKNSGRDESSPFALPTEATPAPKPFSYSQTQSVSGVYGKQQSFFIPNVTSQNFAAAYSNLNSRDSNGGSLLLNGLRETPSGNSSSSNVFARDDSSPVPEQTEAMSLVVAPKKRRNKVTDTRLTPRTVTRISREDGRETSSVSPPLGTGSLHFNSNSLSVPVTLASLQHASEYFDANASAFPFADQARLSSFFSANGADDADSLKSGLTNGGINGTNGVTTNPSVVSAVQAAAAHHLQMLAASRASPDSLNGYSSALLSTYGRGSGTGSENGGDGSETNDTQSVYDPSMPMTSTLSPMHLRKAKLMFFYVRYPSSSVLKMFFPDIKFNKNNTAQLVKWFSNFREFYYIQMEKYARQALSEGIKSAEDLNVTEDCELLRVLNLHYNRSNHIPIPENFRSVCETTLREFFKALQQNKDAEQSWKKAIYKVIARLDDNVPEYFKNPNFMEQLE